MRICQRFGKIEIFRGMNPLYILTFMITISFQEVFSFNSLLIFLKYTDATVKKNKPFQIGIIERTVYMNWKFWQNQKAKVAVPVTAAAIVVVAAGIAVAVHFIQPGMITQQQAQSIALEHAGVREEDALALKVSRDDGKYDVSFRTADRTYEYEIQGRSGQVVDFSYESAGGTSQTVSGNSGQSAATAVSQEITQEQAKAIALEHAGAAEADVVFYRAEPDRDDGRNVYDVEFYVGNTEYDYEIAADTGEVLSYDSDIEGWAVSSQNGSPVTLEQARDLVVSRISGISAQDVRIHEDWDDGRQVYEGEAWFDGVEYEFEIDASTGTFLNWSAEGR